MKVNIVNIASINIALYAFFALNPFFRWIVEPALISIFFAVSTFLISWRLTYVKDRMLSSNTSLIGVALFLLFVLYITMPVLPQYSLRISHFAWFLPIAFFLFYDKDILRDSYSIFIKILYFLSIYALIIYLLNFIGLSVPYVEMQRGTSTMSYRIYGLSVALYRGGAPVQTGLGGIERLNGPLAEPGHFGIILGIILFL